MKLFCIVFSFLLTSSLFAQQGKTDLDPRLLEVFEKDYLNSVQTNNPILIKRWTFYLDNSFYLADFDLKKFPKTLPSINIKDLGKINILKIEKEQSIQKDWNLPKAFKIKNTQKLLVYHSSKEFNKQFRLHISKDERL